MRKDDYIDVAIDVRDDNGDWQYVFSGNCFKVTSTYPSYGGDIHLRYINKSRGYSARCWIAEKNDRVRLVIPKEFVVNNNKLTGIIKRKESARLKKESQN